MINKYNLTLLLIILLSGCLRSSIASISNEGKIANKTIEQAILDFSKSRLFKLDSIFSVKYSDRYYPSVTETDSLGNSKWVKGDPDSSIEVVTLLGYYGKFFLTDSTMYTLPSRYLLKDGKLFYWHDKNYKISEETIEVYRKYNLIIDGKTLDDILEFFEPNTDGTKKEAAYFFCKGNISKYKRVFSKLPVGHYAPPKLQCP